MAFWKHIGWDTNDGRFMANGAPAFQWDKVSTPVYRVTGTLMAGEKVPPIGKCRIVWSFDDAPPQTPRPTE